MDISRDVGVIVTSILALTGLIVLISRANSKNLFLAELFFVTLLVIFAVIVWILVFRNTTISWLFSTFYFSLLLLFILFAYFNATKGILVMTGSATFGLLGLALSTIAINDTEDEVEERKEEITGQESVAEAWYEISGNTNLKEEEEKVDKKAKIMPYGLEEESYAESKANVKTKGKYIASKIGKKFHSPDCGWAVKIDDANKTWLKDKQDALKHELEPCYCVR